MILLLLGMNFSACRIIRETFSLLVLGEHLLNEMHPYVLYHDVSNCFIEVDVND